MTQDSRKHEAERKTYESEMSKATTKEERNKARKRYDTALHRLSRQTGDLAWRTFLDSRRRFIASQVER